MEASHDNYVDIELWDGFHVSANKTLASDMDFLTDLNDAIKNNDMRELIAMYMAIISGDNPDEMYDKIRSHILETTGAFSMQSFMDILNKIDKSVFPKAGIRASRRSWRSLTR